MQDKVLLLDLSKFIAALFVVAIHVHPFYDLNDFLGYFVSEILSRFAVPFFFMTSGFFFIKKIEKKKGKEYFKKILTLYLVWSLLYLPIIIVDVIYGNTNISLLGYCFNLLITGSYYHLWYLTALIYSLILIYFLKDFPRGLLFLIAVSSLFFLLGTSYQFLGIHIPFMKLFI